MKKWINIFGLAWWLTFPAIAQVDTMVMDFETFMDFVQEHHPMARQADLQIRRGAANLQRSRGAFDPKAIFDASQKYFDGKQYYSLIHGGLKVPTWFGIELTTAYEQNGGVFLDPENNTPNSGLFYSGISLPIGRGLFIDERRATLRNAKLFQQSAALERILMLNDLLYDAGKAYWDWFLAFNVLNIYQDALAVAQQRLDAVRQGAALGDRPSIDTLEATIQVQTREINVQQATVDYVNATTMLSVYLWSEGLIPLEVAPGTVPPILEESLVLDLSTQNLNTIDSLISNHPALRQTEVKIEQLDVERRLKQEMLKPQLNLKYNLLTESTGNQVINGISPNDYTWGASFQMPLFIRKERGDLELARIKIQETELDLKQKQAHIQFKANAALNDWQNTVDQFDLYTETVTNYFDLLQGERQLFLGGESSLFMVNSREMSYIQASIKLAEIAAKNRKAKLMTDYILGILNQAL